MTKGREATWRVVLSRDQTGQFMGRTAISISKTHIAGLLTLVSNDLSSSDVMMFIDILEQAVLPSVLFLLTTCVLCIWFAAVFRSFVNDTNSKNPVTQESSIDNNSHANQSLPSEILDLGKPSKV